MLFFVFIGLTSALTPGECIEKLTNYSIDGACFQLLLSKLLGYLMISASLMLKVPQLLKIYKNSSVEGISLTSFYFEVLGFSIMSAYSIHNSNPFSTYGELVIISIQCILQVLLFWTVGNVSYSHKIQAGTFFVFGWFIPLFVISVYEISQLKFIENNKIFLFQLIISIFLIIFNNKNFISDLEILELEKNKMYKSVINESLLVEKLNFKDYVNKRESYLNISNIKNINFFKDKNAPIAFSNSGNIEKAYFRRYEYLAKYADSKAQNQKYIINSNGLVTNAQYWCNYLSNNAFMHDNKTKKFVKCK